MRPNDQYHKKIIKNVGYKISKEIKNVTGLKILKKIPNQKSPLSFEEINAILSYIANRNNNATIITFGDKILKDKKKFI